MALAIGLMMSLPFLVPVHRLPVPSFESEWLALLLGVLGLCCFCLPSLMQRWRLPPLALAPLGLALLVALQGAAGLAAYPGNAALVCACLIWAALLAVAGRSLAASFGRAAVFDTLAWWVLGGGLANAGIGLLQYLQPAGLPVAALALAPGSGIYGNLAQQNHFATQVALALAAALYLRRRARLPWRWCAPLALALGTALLLSGSRSSLLYLGWLALVLLAGTPLTLRRRALAATALTLAAGAGAIWLAAGQAQLAPPLARLAALGEGLAPRLFIWEHAWQMFANHPWLGVGIDGFGHALVGQLEAGARMWGVDQYAHNLPLQLLAVTGLAGFLAVAAPALLWLRRVALDAPCPGRAWGAMVLGVLGIHSMLEQPLYYAYFLGLAALVGGALDPAGLALQAGVRVRWALGLLLCAALGLLAKTAYDYQRLAQMFYSSEAGDTRDSAHLTLLRALQAGSLLQPMAELIAPELVVGADAGAAAKLALNSRLMRFAPIAEVMYRQAALLAEDGQPQAALIQLERAARAWPDELALYRPRYAALARQQPGVYAGLAAHAASLSR